MIPVSRPACQAMSRSACQAISRSACLAMSRSACLAMSRSACPAMSRPVLHWNVTISLPGNVRRSFRQQGAALHCNVAIRLLAVCGLSCLRPRGQPFMRSSPFRSDAAFRCGDGILDIPFLHLNPICRILSMEMSGRGQTLPSVARRARGRGWDPISSCSARASCGRAIP